MLEVEKKQVGNATVVRLTGALDEHANLASLIGKTAPELHVHCRDILRINSVGIRHWNLYFEGLRKSGITLKFLEVPSSLIDVTKSIPGFLPKKEVESLSLDFACTSCQHNETKVYLISELEKSELGSFTIPCEKCKGKMEFDDVPMEYFAFLSR